MNGVIPGRLLLGLSYIICQRTHFCGFCEVFWYKTIIDECFSGRRCRSLKFITTGILGLAFSSRVILCAALISAMHRGYKKDSRGGHGSRGYLGTGMWPW